MHQRNHLRHNTPAARAAVTEPQEPCELPEHRENDDEDASSERDEVERQPDEAPRIEHLVSGLGFRVSGLGVRVYGAVLGVS